MLPTVLTRPVRGAALAACAGALALGAAACGGDGGGDAEPASAVPATAPIYFEVAVRPEGDVGSGADAAMRKVLQTDDPGAELQKHLFEGEEIDYADDVEPWLGEQVGVFLTGFSGDDADGAAVIEQTDGDAASSFVEEQAKEDGAEQRTYNDVDYWASDDTAYGVVEDYVVTGSERGLKTVVDTLDGDDVATIDESEEFERALDAVGGDDDALGVGYVSTQGLLDALSRSGGVPPQALSGIRQAIVSSGGTASALKLTANGDAIALETATIGGKVSSTGGADGDAAAAVAGLPGDAWLGIGIGAIGERLSGVLDQVAQAGALGGVDVEQLLQQFERGLGLSLEQDLLSWMGDGALFARGTSIADIGGALVVETSDPATTKATIGKVTRILRQASPGTTVRPLRGVDGADDGVVLSDDAAPVQVLMAVGGDRFVIGVGRQAVEAALSPQTTLADSDTFQAAGSALGDGLKPTFFLDVAPLIALAEGLGAGDAPEWAEVRKYLDAIASVAGGGTRDGDVQRGKLVVTLK